MLDGTTPFRRSTSSTAFAYDDITGNLASVVVTIGAQSAVVYNVGFGPIANAYTGFHEKREPHADRDFWPRRQRTLSRCRASLPIIPRCTRTSLGEVTVQEASMTVGGGSVPEPATWQ